MTSTSAATAPPGRRAAHEATQASRRRRSDVDTNGEEHVDVAVIGGGPSGLSAAVTLARSRRSVVVLDAGQPRNAPAGHAHNVLGHEGIRPLDLLAAGRAEARGYGVTIRDALAVSASRHRDRFAVGLAGGDTLTARRLLLASGLVDELPDVPGVKEQWGNDVIHCAYCHGWEVRGKRIGILATSPAGVHQALMFNQLSDRVTLFTHTMPDLGEAREQLAAVGVEVVDGRVRALRSEQGDLRAVVLDDGHEVPVDTVVITPRYLARGELYQQPGGTLTNHPFGAFIPADAMTGMTDVPGVWAAGNSSDLSTMVGGASAAGVKAGSVLNFDLITEDAAAAIQARRRGSAATTDTRIR